MMDQADTHDTTRDQIVEHAQRLRICHQDRTVLLRVIVRKGDAIVRAPSPQALIERLSMRFLLVSLRPFSRRRASGK